MSRHHFVPQWYFRLFNDGGDAIYVLLKRQGAAVRRPAAINRQCFRPSLYGSSEVEASLSCIEGYHAPAIREIIRRAEEAPDEQLPTSVLDVAREAALLQRLRNPHRSKMYADAFAAMECMAQSIVGANIPTVTTGVVHNEWNGSLVVQTLMQIHCALISKNAISDLDCVVLRNRTDIPFLFADCPVVFCNPYLQHNRAYGVLGFQAIGLQVHIPLGPLHHLLLFDSGVYLLRGRQGFVVDITHGADVAQLNALQLHEAIEAAYFHDLRWADAYERLLATHRKDMRERGITVQHGKVVCDNQSVHDGDMLHIFEEHTDARLRLTFVAQPKRPVHISSNAVRSPHLVRQQEAIAAKWALSKLVEEARRGMGVSREHNPPRPFA